MTIPEQAGPAAAELADPAVEFRSLIATHIVQPQYDTDSVPNALVNDSLPGDDISVAGPYDVRFGSNWQTHRSTFGGRPMIFAILPGELGPRRADLYVAYRLADVPIMLNFSSQADQEGVRKSRQTSFGSDDQESYLDFDRALDELEVAKLTELVKDPQHSRVHLNELLITTADELDMMKQTTARLAASKEAASQARQERVAVGISRVRRLPLARPARDSRFS